MRGCGSCNLCCTVMGINMDPHPEPHKPIYTPCRHMCKRGCGIYEIRPEACRVWECLWLFTQDLDKVGMQPLPKELRPDRCGVVLEMNSHGNVIAHCKTGPEFQQEPMASYLRKLANRLTILVGHHESYQLLKTDGRLVDMVRIGCDEEGLVQYAIKGSLEAKIAEACVA